MNSSMDSTKPVINSLDWFRLNLDPGNHEMVKKLQKFLGITVDGIFGFETQKFWLEAINKEVN